MKRNAVDVVFAEASILESQVLVNKDHGHIGQPGLAVENGGDAADALGGVAVAADPGFCTRGFHIQTPGSHGPRHLPYPFQGRIKIGSHLVHAGHNNYLLWAKAHAAGAISYTVHIDHLASG